MPGNYREQIVESDAQKLARERTRSEFLRTRQLRYRRQRFHDAWRRLRLASWRTAVFVPVVALVWVALQQSDGSAVSAIVRAVFFGVALVLGLWGVRWWIGGHKCPNCHHVFVWLDPVVLRGRTCSNCHVPFGYLPTAKDLSDDGEV